MDSEKKIKIEPIDDYKEEVKLDSLVNHDYCKNPKQEELMEPKLEAPEYFEMDRPSEISTKSPIFEYPEYLKLESVDDGVSESAEFLLAQPTKLQIPKCSVCSLNLNEYFIRNRSKYRRIIVILGAVLNGEMSISVAQTSLITANFKTCPNHLPEAVNEVFKKLEINCVDEMYSCSMDKKADLMTIVNSFAPKLYFSQLVRTFLDYSREDGSIPGIKRKLRPSSSKPKPKCIVPVYHPRPPLTLTNRKLILMVGAVLSGKRTVDEAQLLVSKLEKSESDIHLSNAVEEIYRTLNIQNIGKMQWCSMENKKKLMSIVNSISSQLNFAEFSRLLEDFVQEKDMNLSF